MKKGITLLILAGWMAVIFAFSAQNGTQSAEISHTAGYRIVQLTDRILGQERTEEMLRNQAKQLQTVIRKGAHMAEYALLAVFTLLHFCCYKEKTRRFWLWGWGFTVLYAATDEIHQLFVPGRAGMFTDVCIDAFGSLIGILVFMLIYKKRH